METPQQQSLNEQFAGKIGQTYKDSVPHWPVQPKAPSDAPNVLYIVLDDVGFSDLGCYGSEINTPNIDALAGGGLRYSNFNVTAMCSPTRACLLTGRNAHSVGVGIISEWANGFPAYQGRISPKAATLAEVLGEHAYGCYASGKWHLTNLADYGAAGPHNDWPLGRGFSRWYGFHGALIDQWNPELYEDNHPFHFEPRKDYHLSSDLVDRTIGQIRDHVTSTHDKPFFNYLALGACHWPHQVPDSYIGKYRGRYDGGWDQIREQRFARQKALGIVPADAEMAAHNPGVVAWEDVPEDQRRVGCRLQETFAAFLEHTDAEIGRLVDYLRSIGQLDNTMIVLISDNGASPEGGALGAINMRKHMTHEQETIDAMLPRLDTIGSEYSFSHYPMGWAQVSNTPLKWYKKDTHGGGIRAPLIMHWPAGIASRGEVRTQFHHVTDVTPTVLDCIGVEAPRTYRGMDQLAMHGQSMRYTFADAAAPTTKVTQYFELLGDRAVWHEGWKAVVKHAKGADYAVDDRWELYKLNEDFTEVRDLAAQHPDKLASLVDIWWQQADRFGVLPLDDREAERARDFLMATKRSRYEFQPDMARIDRFMVPEISDRDYAIRAELSALTPETEGVIFSWGSRFAGFVLYCQAGELVYEYLYSEVQGHRLSIPMPTGSAVVELNFKRTGSNAGQLALCVDGQQRATLELPKMWWTYSTTAGLTCGLAGVPISEAFKPPFRFNATLQRMVVELGEGPSDDGVGKLWTVFKQQ
ncbi:arylsulfatase [Pantoea sp. 18069]|uniref:arylsulfatase n=1 Tax=Pantoea sp. 18069 TaxID=2681415 RepID=UPI001357E4F2|nr:arylsulfatase [Pantoea sp. 18069]